MGYNPSFFSTKANGKSGVGYGMQPGAGAGKIPRGEDTESFPVENVDWQETVEFCQKLTKLDTKKPTGWVYRLPREAEWEYACRGRSPTYQTFHVGNTFSSLQANFDGYFPYGGAEKGDYLQRTTRVGTYQEKAPHPFGLCDMHGNVLEWCADWYDGDYYKSDKPKDPAGPPEGSLRAYRGGCWSNCGQDCRSGFRRGYVPSNRDFSLGFRCALVPLERGGYK
jgi:formylglycine-generating enzyme required for sulfatase activity